MKAVFVIAQRKHYNHCKTVKEYYQKNITQFSKYYTIQ